MPTECYAIYRNWAGAHLRKLSQIAKDCAVIHPHMDLSVPPA